MADGKNTTKIHFYSLVLCALSLVLPVVSVFAIYSSFEAENFDLETVTSVSLMMTLSYIVVVISGAVISAWAIYRYRNVNRVVIACIFALITIGLSAAMFGGIFFGEFFEFLKS